MTKVSKVISVSEICYPRRLLASLKQAHRLQSTLDYAMAVMAFLEVSNYFLFRRVKSRATVGTRKKYKTFLSC